MSYYEREILKIKIALKVAIIQIKDTYTYLNTMRNTQWLLPYAINYYLLPKY